ncbi:hypothetical protein GXW82_37940 [Streptacidiphilus sp. 4-A2]|nr:hypothetical protein [Streptacidiphilus sp. 4-A2]
MIDVSKADPSTAGPAGLPHPAWPAPVGTPGVGFDELHQRVAARLTGQAYLLTGCRSRSVHCVDRAFELAWDRWPEVSVDRSPEGWLRAAVHELALSPWHQGHRRLLARLPHGERYRTVQIDPQGLTDKDQVLLRALLELPRAQRRALVLHDVVGLDWKQTSTEAEATTPAVYARVVRARRALAEAAPGIVGADPLAPGFGRRLGAQLKATAEHGCEEVAQAVQPDALRRRSLLRERAVTTAAGLSAVAAAGALLAGVFLGTPFHPPAPPFVTYGSIHGTTQPSVVPQPVTVRGSGSPTPVRPANQDAALAAIGAGLGSGRAHHRHGPATQGAPHRNTPERGNSSSRRAQRPPVAFD